MRTFFSIISTIIFVIIICGCHGGESLGLREPEPSGDSGHISGIVYAVLPAYKNPAKYQLYLYRGIDVTATSVETDSGIPCTRTTTTKNDSIYSFNDLPNGTYNITASFLLNGVTYSGELKDIVVRGGLTTSMSNFMIFDRTPDNVITFQGKITDAKGSSLKDATVNLEVGIPRYNGSEADVDHYRDNHENYGANCSCYEAMITTVRTDSNGNYAFTAPLDDGSTFYFVSARYKTSMVSVVQVETPGKSNTNNISLTDYEELEMPMQQISYLCAYTLKSDEIVLSSRSSSSGNATDSSQLLATYAKANKIKGQNMDTVNKVVEKRKSANVSTPIISGSRAGSDHFVEVDLMWDWVTNNGSLDNVYGYNIYRGSSADANFYKVGQIQDAYFMVFYDVDPSLKVNTPVYYTVTSFGAYSKESFSSAVVKAEAMGTISITCPSALTAGNSTLTWNLVQGAKSYTVLVYKSDELPSLNPDYTNSFIAGSAQYETNLLGDNWIVGEKLTPGTYWVAVAASNETPASGKLPYQISYSGFRKITIP